MDLTIILLSAVALAAGVVDSIAGGGGLLTIPALLLAGLPPHAAVATNKLSSTFGSGVACVNFAHKKKVVWKIALTGIPCALVGAFIGAKLALFLSAAILGKIIVILLPLGVGITLIPKKAVHEDVQKISSLDRYFKIPLIGFFIGMYDGFFGPGTGSLFILAFYFFLKLNLVSASGTTKLFNFVSNAIALLTFVIAGKVIYAFGIPMALANIVGNYTGSHIAIKKGAPVVKVFLFVSLSILFVTLVVRYVMN